MSLTRDFGERIRLLQFLGLEIQPSLVALSNVLR
jgi:hypothetical protein